MFCSDPGDEGCKVDVTDVIKWKFRQHVLTVEEFCVS